MLKPLFFIKLLLLLAIHDVASDKSTTASSTLPLSFSTSHLPLLDDNTTDEVNTTLTIQTTLPPITPPRPTKQETQPVGKVKSHCSADGTTEVAFKSCNYTIDTTAGFSLATCPAVDSLANCTEDEYGYGNCMLCIHAVNTGGSAKSGTVKFQSGIIPETGPQCQLRVRVVSEGSPDIGSWKIYAQLAGKQNLLASLHGSYEGEFDLIARLYSKKNIEISVIAEQLSNFTGRKAIGSIDFEFCSSAPLETEQTNFICANGKQISWSVVCDFVDDCGDSSDETQHTAGCGYTNSYCMYPNGCSLSRGWNPIKGRIIPRLQGDEQLDGFLPPSPVIASGASLPGITNDKSYPNGIPLVVDLSSDMTEAGDVFLFALPEVNTVRDIGDESTQCWLRFHYYVPPGLQAEISIIDGGSSTGQRYFARNLQAISSSEWIRNQVELPLYSHPLSSNETENDNTKSFYRPTIRIEKKNRESLKGNTDLGENGLVGLWGLSYSQGCRTFHNYCPKTTIDRASSGYCKRNQLSCSLAKPVELADDTIHGVITPSEDGTQKGFCYSPTKRCDFTCDCIDCSDETDCGSSCNFTYPETCGWLTGDNWLWPSVSGSLCNGQPCIVTSPDAFYHLLQAPTFLKDRALLSNMYQVMNPVECILTFSYQLWPSTGLSVTYIGSDNSNVELFSDSCPNSPTVQKWQMGSVNFTEFIGLNFVKFRLAFQPKSTVHTAPMYIANQPVGLSKIQFSSECGLPYEKSPAICPPKEAVCEMEPGKKDKCVTKIEEPITECNLSLVLCNSTAPKGDKSCFWQPPPPDSSSLFSTKIYEFNTNDNFCNVGACFAVLSYTITKQPLQTAYLAMAFEELGVPGTFSEDGIVARRQRIWQILTSDYYESSDYTVRIPFNYCPTDLEANKPRNVRVYVEGTANQGVDVKSVLLTDGCFSDMKSTAFNGRQIVCSDNEVRCTKDQRCYPRTFVCEKTPIHKQFLAQICSNKNNDFGFDNLPSNCFQGQTKSAAPAEAHAQKWSASRITGLIVGILASVILVVFASYAITKRMIQWYRSGGGHRHRPRQNSDETENESSPVRGTDGQYFQPLIGMDNSTQMMLDMLVNDDENMI